MTQATFFGEATYAPPVVADGPRAGADGGWPVADAGGAEGEGKVRYASVCSGIEAATVAWHELGWRPLWFSEIDKFPSAVLKHHYPEVPNRGDFTQIEGSDPVGVLVGGTPCQDFSIAGLRAGLDGARGNLTLEFLKLVDRIRPRWILWENVPGVLSIDGGRTFGSFLGGLAKLGYGFAYRVLDAQYFGLAQRRQRVFVVGCLGDWRRAAAVLFDSESMLGNPAPSREARQSLTPSIARRTQDGSGLSIEVCGPLCANNGRCQIESTYLPEYMAVRRLTPRECERLQGFADDYTLIPYRGKPAADGPRYKALGNSFPVPVIRWIGRRIELADKLVLRRTA